MDTVLRGSPTRDPACRAQVDVGVFASHPRLPGLTFFSFTHSYKDFSECFPLWCEEQPSGAEGVFNTVSSFIETHIVVRLSFPFSPRRLIHFISFYFWVARKQDKHE
jgi:hypothetical protein